jgi:polysaccharide deacetylase 2 family uncharacterized protein YibQ
VIRTRTLKIKKIYILQHQVTRTIYNTLTSTLIIINLLCKKQACLQCLLALNENVTYNVSPTHKIV